MKIEEARKIVFKEKRVFGEIFEKYKDKNWTEYLKENLPKNISLSDRNLELLEVFGNVTEKILGKEKAQVAREALEESFFVSTCDHHGILCHPFFLNASLIRSQKNILKKNKATIVLSCGGVSTSNSSFPRGLFFSDETYDEVRMPFVSLKHKSRPVHGLPKIPKKDFEKVLDRTISKSIEKIARKIEQLKDFLLSDKKIFEFETFSEQCSLISNILWKETFGKERGELIYIEMESVTTELLLQKHFGKNTEIEKVIFDKEIREKFLKNLEGIQGAHNTKEKKGSHLFWYIDGDKRKQLFLKDNKLQTLEGEVKIDLDKGEIERLLIEKKLMPTMALCFSTLSFYHGLNCGGGFSQVGYLREMYEAYKKTFGNSVEKNEQIKTDIFTGEFVLASSFVKKKNIPATLLDLFIYSDAQINNKIEDVIQKVKIGDTIDLMMGEFYKIITGEEIEIENMSKIPSVLGKSKERKCINCGNNPTNHFHAYVMQTATVILTPLLKIISLMDTPFMQRIIKIILVPYLWFFRGVGMIKFNRDKNKAFTKRAEVIWYEAEKRGIEMEQFALWGKPIEQYRAKINGKWRYFESIPLPDGGSARSYTWMDDKSILKKKFYKVDIPVAYGESVSSLKRAYEVFDKADKPLIVKPQLGSRGRHTTTHIYTKEELVKAYKIAKKLCHFVLVEEHLFGSVFRATYVGSEIVGILRGDPPRVTGDDKHTIAELIVIKNENKKDMVKDVAVNSQLIEFIGRQNLTTDSVLEKGQTIDLSEKIGISYGGFAVEEFPKTHPKLLAYLKRAGDFLNAPVVGFDFIIQDATKDPDTQKWGIIEANSLPFINLHHFPLEGDPINVASKVWDLWKK